MGNLTLVVAAMSYAGQLNLTAAADRDGCPDVDVFTTGMGRALHELERSVRVEALAQPGSGPERERSGPGT
jgi:hypothetical protein